VNPVRITNNLRARLTSLRRKTARIREGFKVLEQVIQAEEILTMLEVYVRFSANPPETRRFSMFCFSDNFDYNTAPLNGMPNPVGLRGVAMIVFEELRKAKLDPKLTWAPIFNRQLKSFLVRIVVKI
jgi:hypothetical protein